jgi:hypothetical protein
VHAFAADLWLWDARRADTWTFVTVPQDVSVAIEDEAELRGLRAGFGSVRVEVRIGVTVWSTSVFPDKDSGCFVLPIKKAVRKVEGLEVGDVVEVSVEVLG